MSEIKWAYNEGTGSFSALPASNFLLLAIGFICLLPLLEKGYWEHKRKPKPCPNIDANLHKVYAERYKELLPKYIAGDSFTVEEYLDWKNIQHPPWAEPGETWAYPLD